MDVRREEVALIELQRQVCYCYLHAARMVLCADRSSEEQAGSIDSQAWSVISKAEEDALLSAANRVRRWLEVLVEEGSAHTIKSRKWNAVSEALYIVRNKREHFDDLVSSKPIKPNKLEGFAYDYVTKDGETLRVGVNWTFSHEGKLTLGGRLVVAELLDAIVEIYEMIDAKGIWQLPWRPDNLVQKIRSVYRSPVTAGPQ